MRGLTDWEQVARLSNDDIVKAAANDPDSAVPTAEELAEFKPAKPHRKIDEEDENAPEQKKTDSRKRITLKDACKSLGATDWNHLLKKNVTARSPKPKRSPRT